MKRWLKAAVEDGRLKPLDVEFANGQLHSLIKGSCFWPQLLKKEALLDSAERRYLAEQTVAMFLSYYQAQV